MTNKAFTIVMITCTAVSLSACSTVKLPDFDMPSLSQFKEASAKLVEGYPEVSEAPVRPEDLRAGNDWDEAAKALLVQRDGFIVPAKGGMPESTEAISSEIESLKAQVRSYKLDDPQ